MLEITKEQFDNLQIRYATGPLRYSEERFAAYLQIYVNAQAYNLYLGLHGVHDSTAPKRYYLQKIDLRGFQPTSGEDLEALLTAS